MEWHKDSRWGYYKPILNSEFNINMVINNSYSLEFWFKLKHYPVINRKTTKENNPTLLFMQTGTTDRSKYGKQLFRVSFGKKHIRSGQSVIRYPESEWFQLVLVNGAYNKTSSGGVGKCYLNGKLVDDKFVLPERLNRVIVGQKLLASGDQIVRNNPTYHDCIVGDIRIYNRALDKYEINTNYYASAKNYGLVLNKSTNYVNFGLIRKYGNEKNLQNNYMDTQDLSNLFAQLHKSLEAKANPGAAKKTQNCEGAFKGKTKHRTKDIKADLILLNSNPEYFRQMLRNKSNKKDTATKKVLYKTTHKSKNDMQKILDNPLKSQILITYLKQNPKYFMKILESNIFTADQLSQLNTILKREESNPHTQPEGFTNYDENYQRALTILDSYSDTPAELPVMDMHRGMMPPVPLMQQSIDHAYESNQLDRLANSTSRIANMMHQNRHHEKEQTVADRFYRLNMAVRNDKDRIHQLEKTLAMQSHVLGVLVNRAGKCVGLINRNGKVNGQAAEKEPVRVIMNKSKYQINLANILKQHQFHNSTVKELLKSAKKDKNMTVLGQCVNRKYNTIGTIIRYGGETLYIPTIESKPLKKLPVLAVIDANTAQVPKSGNKKANADKCKGGKCAPGYKQEMPAEAKNSWTTAVFGKPRPKTQEEELEEARDAEKKAIDEKTEADKKQKEANDARRKAKAAKREAEKLRAKAESDE